MPLSYNYCPSQLALAKNEGLDVKCRDLEERLLVESAAKSRLQNTLEKTRKTVERLMDEQNKLIESEEAERQEKKKLFRQFRRLQNLTKDLLPVEELPEQRAINVPMSIEHTCSHSKQDRGNADTYDLVRNGVGNPDDEYDQQEDLNAEGNTFDTNLVSSGIL